MTKSEVLVAAMHPPQYMLHKYWARKPHNILRHYLKEYFVAGDTVCDPFCGSGVFLAEAKKQDINSIGYDINPLAAILSEVTINPPAADALRDEIERVIGLAESSFQFLYALADGVTVRYSVHQAVTSCKNCGTNVTVDDCKKIGNKYVCSICAQRLFFNAENLISTRIVKIIGSDGRTYENSRANRELFSNQQQLSEAQHVNDSGKYDLELVPNRRILAFPGMKVSRLFTARAFSICSFLFDAAHSSKANAETKKATLLFLTSNLAQFSRLIPYRNNLTTGGPAWTVPGFWIAPIHLETNPLNLLRSRAKRFIKGIEASALSYKSARATASVENLPMQVGMEQIDGHSLDGVFFDPPYGDNVPYLEFSAIWNAFLKLKVDYDSEIVVSDRNEHKSNWTKYSSDVDRAIGLFAKKLKVGGRVIMTFNNLDPRAWEVILRAFSEHGFSCTSANYQIPAVTSSKAQLAANTSYVGDFYCVFKNSKKIMPRIKGTEAIIKSILPVFLSRNGRAPKNQVVRNAILTALKSNLEIEVFQKMEEIIYGIAEEHEGYYVLREELAQKYSAQFAEQDLKKKVLNVAANFMAHGKILFNDFYPAVVGSTQLQGPPDYSELKVLLKGSVLFDGDYCYLQEAGESQRQSSFFKA